LYISSRKRRQSSRSLSDWHPGDSVCGNNAQRKYYYVKNSGGRAVIFLIGSLAIPISATVHRKTNNKLNIAAALSQVFFQKAA
jgi:hypothetical protein